MSVLRFFSMASTLLVSVFFSSAGAENKLSADAKKESTSTPPAHKRCEAIKDTVKILSTRVEKNEKGMANQTLRNDHTNISGEDQLEIYKKELEESKLELSKCQK